MGKMFMIREEYFGGSMIRRKNLTFDFLNDWQMRFLKEAKVSSLQDALSSASYAPADGLERFVGRAMDAGMFGSDGLPDYDIRESHETKESLPHGILRSPLRLYFEITRRCNLRCRNCLSSSGKPYIDELSNDEVLKILDMLRRDDVLETRITGGEPTMRPGWQGIVRHALDLGMAVSLNTNGVYSSSSVRDEIISLGVDQVIVSLDGSKHAHESLRGEGTYKETLDTIQYLSRRANNIRVNTILKDETIPFVPALVDMAEEYGTEICFILLRPMGRGTELLDAIPSASKLYETVNLVNKIRSEHKGIKIMTSYDVIQANSNKPAPDLDLTGCAAALRGCGISSRGRVECCGFVAELTDKFNPGNVRDSDYSLLSMWRTSGEMQAFRQLNLETNRRCISCEDYAKRCYGTCVTMRVYADLNISHIDPYCMHTHG